MGNKNSNQFVDKSLSENEISELVNKTNYTRDEIIEYHKKFITYFPKGQLNKKQFVEYFTQLRPDRDAELFCAQLFNAFDTDKSGKVSFEEFLIAISLSSDKDPKQQLRLAFRMYDLDNDNKLTLKEVENIVVGIHKFNGAKLNDDGTSKTEIAQLLLKKYDLDKNAFLTEDEFISSLAQPTLRAFEQFSVLRTGMLK